MSFLKVENLPTDAAQIETDTDVFFEDTALQTEAILVLGQLDPLETVVGDFDGDTMARTARWSGEQQALIIKARDMLGDWQS